MPEQTGGIKHDQNKLRYDLLPAEALMQVVKVFTDGAVKYSDRNWEQGLAWGRLFAAAMRHLWAWWSRHNKDEESGHSHLAHAAACILMLLHHEMYRRNLDDRPAVSFCDEASLKDWIDSISVTVTGSGGTDETLDVLAPELR